MKRRAFIKAFAGAVATVAIGMRVAQGMPELKIITGIDDMEHTELRYKATERFSQFNQTDWRAVYGSPG